MNTKNLDDDYANMPYIPGGESYPDTWERLAREFRAKTDSKLDLSYGPRERQRFDLFFPKDEPKGLIIFVHGGYWMKFDKSLWSHLATGGIEAGYVVAMPAYTLCPQVRISDITIEIAQAITKITEMISGPVYLCGHSAGGHLASRMVSSTSPLQKDVLQRIKTVVSISGVHDLRPLLQTSMNETLQLDMSEAEAESPALLQPSPDTTAPLTCWVGANERPVFVWQNTLIPHARVVMEPGKHHFDIIEGLLDPEHDLMKVLLNN